MLEKVKIKFRKANLNDIDLIAEWMSSQDFKNYFYEMPVESARAMKLAVAAMIEESSAELTSNIIFVAEIRGPVGLVFFNRIDWKNRNLFISIIVGKEKMKNKIYGVKMFGQAIGMAFDEFNMHKVCGYIHEYNAAMLRIVDFFGGKKEGYLKMHIKRDNEYFGNHVYSFFKKDHPGLIAQLNKM